MALRCKCQKETGGVFVLGGLFLGGCPFKSPRQICQTDVGNRVHIRVDVVNSNLQRVIGPLLVAHIALSFKHAAKSPQRVPENRANVGPSLGASCLNPDVDPIFMNPSL